MRVHARAPIPKAAPRTGRLAAFGVLSVLSLLPSPGAAQIDNCEFLPGTRNWTTRNSGGSSITYVSRPRIRCNDGRYIEADSAVSFTASGYTELLGQVYFQDASQSLRGAEARYYDSMRRLEASGAVVLTDRQSGNVMTGERLIYLREMPNRPREELTLQGGRPTATLLPGAGDDPPPPGETAPAPYEVEADNIYLLGEALFRAWGDVEVVRDSLDARADSMDYDREGGVIDFKQNAELRQAGMDLRARHIQLILPGDVISEIHATEDAELLGEDLDLDAYLIHMFLVDDALERLVAIGERRALAPDEADDPEEAAEQPMADPAAGQRPPVRPGAGRQVEPLATDTAEADLGLATATAEGLVMTADSLDVTAPGEILERVVAVGRARAVSTARDSLNTADTPELVRNDWIEGDTVVAHLRHEAGAEVVVAGRPTPPTDPDAEAARAIEPDAASGRGERASSRSYALERLVASVGARSLYRMPPDSSETAEPVDTTGAADADAAREPDQAAEAQDTLLVTDDTLQVVGDSLPATARPTLTVHYVEADRIEIVFVEGAVDLMQVEGLQRGIYLQPARQGTVATTRTGGHP